MGHGQDSVKLLMLVQLLIRANLPKAQRKRVNLVDVDPGLTQTTSRRLAAGSLPGSLCKLGLLVTAGNGIVDEVLKHLSRVPLVLASALGLNVIPKIELAVWKPHDAPICNLNGPLIFKRSACSPGAHGKALLRIWNANPFAKGAQDNGDLLVHHVLSGAVDAVYLADRPLSHGLPECPTAGREDKKLAKVCHALAFAPQSVHDHRDHQRILDVHVDRIEVLKRIDVFKARKQDALASNVRVARGVVQCFGSE